MPRRSSWRAPISDHLLPHTPAYREIWLDGERIAGGEGEVVEPIYGKTYLPRKFKVVVAVPPSNDVDMFAHDLGYIAIADDAGNIIGWNVTVGGGMGMTHGEPDTYPRTADVMGFCETADAVKIAEAVVTVQRDWGDRKNRKHARLKYTIEDRGLDAFRAEVEKRAGVKLAPAKPFTFTSTGDRYGWSEGADGRGHLTLFVQNGRVHDVGGAAQQTALRTIAQMHDGDFRITPNQNLIIANVPTSSRRRSSASRARPACLRPGRACGAIRWPASRCRPAGWRLPRASAICPSCSTRSIRKLAAHGLSADDIVIRMTGCPNGCARPYLAEIGLVGKGPGRYNLYLGAAFDGSRMNKLYAEDLDHAGIVAALDPLFAAYAAGAAEGRALRRLRHPCRPHRRERQRRRLPRECAGVPVEIGGSQPGLVLAVVQDEQGQDDQKSNKQNRRQAFPEQQRIALDERLRRRCDKFLVGMTQIEDEFG